MKQILFGLSVAAVTAIIMSNMILAAQKKNLDRIEDGVYNLREQVESLEEHCEEPVVLALDVTEEITIPEEPEEVKLTLSEPELVSLGTFEVTAYCPCPK